MHICSAVSQLMVYMWFQNLKFESFCIGFMDTGENLLLSGLNFSSALGPDSFEAPHTYCVFRCSHYIMCVRPEKMSLYILIKYNKIQRYSFRLSF